MTPSDVLELRRKVYAASLLVPCPLCLQPVNQPCTRFISSSGTRRAIPKPHAKRIDAAQAAGHWSIG